MVIIIITVIIILLLLLLVSYNISKKFRLLRYLPDDPSSSISNYLVKIQFRS